MMRATISGRAGIAILEDGDQLLSIDLDRAAAPVPRSPRIVRFLLNDMRDLVVVEGDLEAIRQQLEDARHCDDALQLTIFMMDAKLSATRDEVCGALEVLFARELVQRYVEGVLYAHPAPASADLGGALEAARRTHSKRVEQLFAALADHQQAIEETWTAWALLPEWLFDSADDRVRTRVAFVRAGMFRRAVELRSTRACLETIAIDCAKEPALRRIRGARFIVELWLAPVLDRFRPVLEQIRTEEHPWRLFQAFDGDRADRVVLLRHLFFVKLSAAQGPDILLRLLTTAPPGQRFQLLKLLKLLDEAGVRIELPSEGVRQTSELTFYPPPEFHEAQIAHPPITLQPSMIDLVVDFHVQYPLQGWEKQFMEGPPPRATRAASTHHAERV